MMVRSNRFVTFAAAAVMVMMLSAVAGAQGKGAAAPKVVINAEYNGAKIPVTVFYSAATESELSAYTIDSLRFSYGGNAHSVLVGESSQFFQSPTEHGLSISMGDFNFDGYPDIAMPTSSGTYNSWSAYFIYDQKTKLYSRHQILSELIDVSIDEKTKTLSSYGKGGHAGLIYNYTKYKWHGGELTLIHSENQDYDSDMDMYIRITKTLQDGNWAQRTDTVNSEFRVVSGKSEKFVPIGYTLVQKIQGDLNKDGAADDVLIIQKKNGDNHIKGLVVAFKKGNIYELMLENRECIGLYQEAEPTIGVRIRNGNILIDYSGQRETYVYNFRYQNSDFELIGYDCKYSTNSDEGVYVHYEGSINFLSKKKLSKGRENRNAKFTEKWETFTMDKPIRLYEIENFGEFNINEKIKIAGQKR